jgi:hypothetical protein
MDAVVIGSILTVVVSIVILGVLAVRVGRQINQTHSKDDQ